MSHRVNKNFQKSCSRAYSIAVWHLITTNLYQLYSVAWWSRIWEVFCMWGQLWGEDWVLCRKKCWLMLKQVIFQVAVHARSTFSQRNIAHKISLFFIFCSVSALMRLLVKHNDVTEKQWKPSVVSVMLEKKCLCGMAQQEPQYSRTQEWPPYWKMKVVRRHCSRHIGKCRMSRGTVTAI